MAQTATKKPQVQQRSAPAAVRALSGAMVSYQADGQLVNLDFATVRDVICKDQTARVTDAEVIFFMHFCKALEANPFIGDAYLIKYDDKYPAANVVGVGYHEKKADTYEDYDGKQDGIVVQTKDGQIIDRDGTLKLPNETLIGGWCKVYRKLRSHPTFVRVSFDRYCRKKNDGTPMALWKSNPEDQICKVARSQALRQTFKKLKGALIEAELNPALDAEVSGITVTLEDLKRELWGKIEALPIEKRELPAISPHLSEEAIYSYMVHVSKNMALGETDLYIRTLNDWDKSEPFRENFIVKFSSWMSKSSRNGEKAGAISEKPEAAVEGNPKDECSDLKKKILAAVSKLSTRQEIDRTLTAAYNGNEMSIAGLEQITDVVALQDILTNLKNIEKYC